jgi:REP element-mobilizing transposase RayT
MPYWRLFYHFVWATKQRAPLITPQTEMMIFEQIRTKALGLGATVFAINGTPDHVHLVASVPPKLALATFVGQVKGITSTRTNQQQGINDLRLTWQEGYGVFSFDGKRLPYVIAYVDNQKVHHRQQSTIPILERVDDSPITLLYESNTTYLADEACWRREMLDPETARA